MSQYSVHDPRYTEDAKSDQAPSKRQSPVDEVLHMTDTSLERLQHQIERLARKLQPALQEAHPGPVAPEGTQVMDDASPLTRQLRRNGTLIEQASDQLCGLIDRLEI